MLKNSLAKAISANKPLQKELYTANRRLRKNKDMLDNQKYETAAERLEDALDTLEQYTRKNSLEIHIIPKKPVRKHSRCCHHSHRSTQRLH